MPRYRYKAKQGPGKTIEGEIVAENESIAVARIDQMGFSPIWVKEKEGPEREHAHASTRGISSRDVNVFTRQLSSLIKGGVSILRALLTIGAQTENRRLRAIVGEIENTIRGGKMLSEALSVYPRLFPKLYINLVRSGESGGILDQMLLRLADSREKEEEIRKKVESSLAYPILIVVMGIVTVFVMVAFLLPRIAKLFDKSTHLPLITQILINVSNFAGQYWYMFVIAVAFLLLLLRQFAATEKGRRALDSLALSAPLIGSFVRQADLARFARTLSLLVETGISIDRALELSGSTLRNSILRGEIENVRRETIEQGSAIAASLQRAHHFPPFVVNMVAVGEETGSLDTALAEIASFYERQVELTTRVFTSLLEPILILVIGAVVGFIVFAMLLPIFEIGQTIR